ncbi:Tfp pilus assembly protein PilV [Paraburkholderia bannensis]|uniref:Tfp pilus assembly protein PilV n=1 Tax=Paraburkholderia bannensis TaxID=765414 RepID=A0A7W9TU01_9BURK|nr:MULTISPECIES: hypothetical protein [Paraburkholderia]MBB3255362.1 Tfp pilus assembly protein PilV [Paraburkholderia sp. WP4_3_2]MBB6100626.1 Tfp pilus assembly protein PilV [Paraburkholderia bannensis]
MRRRTQGGSALLEVALAMALMATCGMGLLSAQLALARHASASATRARAAFAVDALVETTLETGSPARDQWRARAAALVANGQVNLSHSQVTLSWTDLRDEAAAGRDCAGTSATEGGRACVALAFAQ